MDNLTDQMGLLSDDLIEECSEDSDDHHSSKNAPLREQDRFLPIANIAKIMKRAIPENGKVSGSAMDFVRFFSSSHLKRGLLFVWSTAFRLQKRLVNVSRSVYLNSYHSLHRRLVNVVKMRSEKQSTAKTYCMPCVHLVSTITLIRWHCTCTNTVKPPKPIETSTRRRIATQQSSVQMERCRTQMQPSTIYRPQVAAVVALY